MNSEQLKVKSHSSYIDNDIGRGTRWQWGELGRTGHIRIFSSHPRHIVISTWNTLYSCPI